MSDKYNKKRKEILLDIDKGSQVDIEELAMYDLTPYIKEKKEPNLYETIILNKNYQRKVEHISNDIYFSPPQYDALTYLYKNDRVILSAPTSFGKTMIVKEYIFRNKPNNIVYIVPTNALAYELETSFKENINFSDYIIYDKLLSDLTTEDNKMFFIGTQEKFLEINNSLLGEIDLFIIDEAYKLQESVDNIRSYKLSETFLNSFILKSKKIFLLSPIAEFSGFDKYNFNYYYSEFNAVEKNYIVLEEKNFYIEFSKCGKKNKTILFCSSPSQINDTYYKLIGFDNKINVKNSKFLSQLKKDIHPNWIVVKLLEKGILTHHGQMPKYIQNKMINLFNNSDYNILLGTNSISEGINTVTKNLFIHPENSFNDKLLLKNTIGRAGRLGQYPIGYIYSTKDLMSELEGKIKIILAISDENELSEIENSKNNDKVKEFCINNNIDDEDCLYLIKKYKISLQKLGKILNELKKDLKFSGIDSLPFVSKRALGKNYTTDPNIDKFLIKGYLQLYFINNNEKIYLNTFNDRIKYYKSKVDSNSDISEIINLYMQFIYSTLEYNIMPIINIGLDLKQLNDNWPFGNNVIESLEKCKKKYYIKNYGNLDIDNLSESHKSIINAMKDYGMTNSIKNLSLDILSEIEGRLNIRYSTSDVIRAIDYLSKNSINNQNFFKNLKDKYID